MNHYKNNSNIYQNNIIIQRDNFQYNNQNKLNTNLFHHVYTTASATLNTPPNSKQINSKSSNDKFSNTNNYFDLARNQMNLTNIYNSMITATDNLLNRTLFGSNIINSNSNQNSTWRSTNSSSMSFQTTEKVTFITTKKMMLNQTKKLVDLPGLGSLWDVIAPMSGNLDKLKFSNPPKSAVSSSISNHHTVVVSGGLSVPCTCNNSNLLQEKIYTSSEFNNIWKLAFFILAFFIGFISLLLIVVFTVKIFMAKFSKRKELKYDLANYYVSQNTKSQPKISSISLLEYDPELGTNALQSSNNASDILKNNSHLANNNLTCINNSSNSHQSNKKRTLSSCSSSPRFNVNKPKHKNSINSRTTSITTAGCTSSIYQLPHQANANVAKNTSHYITEQELNNHVNGLSKLANSSNQPSSQCFIYGIANKGFLDDSQLSFYQTDKEKQDLKNLFDSGLLESSNMANGVSYSSTITSAVPSSFKPAAVNLKNKSNEPTVKHECGLEKTPSNKSKPESTDLNDPITENDEMVVKKSYQHQHQHEHLNDQNAYQVPWKPPNDYEALETNTVTGSLANLSSVTTFSEIYSEARITDTTNTISNNATGNINNENNNNHLTSTNMANTNSDNKSNISNTSSSNSNSSNYKGKSDFNTLICTNTNEHISRSSQITQELEARLKERRQMMESKSDKFQPKIIQESEFASINQAISLSNLEKKLKNWHNEMSTKNIQPSLIKKTAKQLSSSANCVCPCHSHSASSSSTELNHKPGNLMSKSSHGNEIVCIHEHKKTCKEASTLKTQTSSGQSTVITSSTTTTLTAASVSTVTPSTPGESNACLKKPKIIIDGSSTLPTKRESIRMLIENKAVSENKQKNALEMHLNTLICSRKNKM